MKFSVLLLYPDYIASNFGQDTRYLHVDSSSVEQAIVDAQQATADVEEQPEPEDFFPLLVLHGWHDDVRP